MLDFQLIKVNKSILLQRDKKRAETKLLKHINGLSVLYFYKEFDGIK